MAEIEHKTLSRGSKYYRVILTGIDPGKETPDTFALKLSMQTRTPISRINSIVRNLPAPIKSGLDMLHARKFSSILEELGGTAKIESYYLGPGESHSTCGGRRDGGSTKAALNMEHATSDGKNSSGSSKICVSCGWENNEDEKYCEFCHKKFERDEPPNPLNMKEQAPEENPLAKPDSKAEGLTLWDFIARHKIAFLVGLNIFLLLILLARH